MYGWIFYDNLIQQISFDVTGQGGENFRTPEHTHAFFFFAKIFTITIKIIYTFTKSFLNQCMYITSKYVFDTLVEDKMN